MDELKDRAESLLDDLKVYVDWDGEDKGAVHEVVRALLTERSALRQERDKEQLVYEGELIQRAEAAEAEVSTLRAAVQQIEQRMRDEDWHQHTSSPLSVEAVVNTFADALCDLQGVQRTTKDDKS